MLRSWNGLSIGGSGWAPLARRIVANRSAAPLDISVSVICFNQENFITETLAGILSQETDFAYEIVVSDDGSTDRTPSIISDFAEKFPGVIRTNLNPVRVGMKENLLSNLRRCRGNLIALCDGDDLWTHPKKIDRQAKFLMANEDCASVFHRVRHEVPPGQFLQELPAAHMRKSRSTVEDLLREESFMPTSSIMFRRPSEEGWPSWFSRLENVVDLPLNIFLALRGDIGYVDETMGVYRTASSPDAFSSRPLYLVYEEAFRMYELMIENFPSKICSALRENQRRALWQVFLFHARKRNRARVLEARDRLRRFDRKHNLDGSAAFSTFSAAVTQLMRFRAMKTAAWLARKHGPKFLA